MSARFAKLLALLLHRNVYVLDDGDIVHVINVHESGFVDIERLSDDPVTTHTHVDPHRLRKLESAS